MRFRDLLQCLINVKFFKQHLPSGEMRVRTQMHETVFEAFRYCADTMTTLLINVKNKSLYKIVFVKIAFNINNH